MTVAPLGSGPSAARTGRLAAARSRGSVTVVDGLTGLRALDRELAELHVRCRAPVTVRSPWLHASLAYETGEPWTVCVRDATGDLTAAAVLCTRDDGDHDTVTMAGAGSGHRGELVAEHPWAAVALGRALADRLAVWPRPLVVELGPLDATSVAVLELVSALPGARSETVEPIPVVSVDSGRRVSDYLSPSLQRTLHKAGNRLARDGRDMSVRFTRDPRSIVRVLPVLAELHVARDHDRGRPSELDDGATRLLWQARMRALADARALELATAHVGGSLAAYVLAVPDAPAYRVLEGHLATEWSRYAPGRVLEAAVLQRVLDDRTYSVLDWMTSVAAESLLATNDAQSVVMVRLD